MYFVISKLNFNRINFFQTNINLDKYLIWLNDNVGLWKHTFLNHLHLFFFKHEQRSYDIFRSYFDDVLQKCKNNLINIQTSFTEVEKELIMTFCEKDYEFIFDVINGRSKSPKKFLYQVCMF